MRQRTALPVFPLGSKNPVSSETVPQWLAHPLSLTPGQFWVLPSLHHMVGWCRPRWLSAGLLGQRRCSRLGCDRKFVSLLRRLRRCRDRRWHMAASLLLTMIEDNILYKYTGMSSCPPVGGGSPEVCSYNLASRSLMSARDASRTGTNFFLSGKEVRFLRVGSFSPRVWKFGRHYVSIRTMVRRDGSGANEDRDSGRQGAVPSCLPRGHPSTRQGLGIRDLERSSCA